MYKFKCSCLKLRYVHNIDVQHSLEKNETATMFFLKKTFLVVNSVIKQILSNLTRQNKSLSQESIVKAKEPIRTI